VATIASEFEGSRSFVLKDPRMCRLTGFWADVFAEMGIRPLFVLPVRNPLEIAASVHRRDGIEPWLTLLVWQRHVLESEFRTRGFPRVFTSYDDLLADWRQVTDRIGSTLGLTWPRSVSEAAGEMEALLSDKHRHHHAVSDEALPANMRELFGIIDRWSHDGESSDDFLALDRIRNEFDEASAAFSGYVELVERAVDDKNKISAQLAEAKDQAKVQLAEAKDQAKDQLARANDQLVETKQQLVEAKEQHSRLQTDLAEMQAQLINRDTEILGRDTEILNLRQEIEALKARRFVLRLRK
jgi:hypothetical protein